jgi:hypothetical protein
VRQVYEANKAAFGDRSLEGSSDDRLPHAAGEGQGRDGRVFENLKRDAQVN